MLAVVALRDYQEDVEETCLRHLRRNSRIGNIRVLRFTLDRVNAAYDTSRFSVEAQRNSSVSDWKPSAAKPSRRNMV